MNGDTANKIGTYQISIVAKYHNVPFYVAAPFTTIDMNISDGEKIIIEERPAEELTHIGGQRIAAPGLFARLWNYLKMIPDLKIRPLSAQIKPMH